MDEFHPLKDGVQCSHLSQHGVRLHLKLMLNKLKVIKSPTFI